MIIKNKLLELCENYNKSFDMSDIYEKSEIIGLTYRSSQKITNGIGVRTESIGYGTKDINPKRIYIARIEL